MTAGVDREGNDVGEDPRQGGAVEESLGIRVNRYLEAPGAPSESGIDRVGEHVASVLRAAEDAAERIEADARQEAARVVEEARREASEQADAARERVQTATAEAERLRLEAEAWSRQTREAAETYSSERRADGESAASEIVSDAKQRAAAIGEEAERRQQALKMDVSLAEERLRKLASGLHELADRLDELLMPASTITANSDDRELMAHESLIDALAPALESEESGTAWRGHEGGVNIR
jgi:vacuolar-type H+-ATPase subunit E/Vma4